MYNLISAILRRPVSVFMFYLGIIILGVISINEFDISLLPPLDFPQITVHAVYPGGTPEEVEQGVARPLEEALGSVNGVTEVLSRSMPDEALITVKLAWGTDMKYAALNIRQQADRVYSYFPEGARRPVVNLRNPQNRPVTTLALSGASLPKLKRFAEYVIKKRLEQISGVAEAAIMGAPTREIKVRVDPNVLTEQGFTVSDLQTALKNNNLLVSGGSIKTGNFRLALRIRSEFQTVGDISQTPVFRRDGSSFVPLNKLAKIEDSFKEPQSLTRINGKPCIAVDVYKESGSNALKISKQIKKVLSDLQKNYNNVRIDVVYSQARFIKSTLNNVLYAILAGAFLAVAALFLFLSNWRAPLIISVSIPVSIIAAFLWMNFSGIGLNIISLAGLALGGGMLVDNSIVVLENIHRYRETGKDAFDSAALGAAEVAMPITASTLTTIAVFIPIIFLKDLSAAVFTEEAKTVSYALLASLAVSLTLLPVVYIFMEKRRKISADIIKVSPLNNKLISCYERVMNLVLKHENVFLMIIFFILLLSLALSYSPDRRLLPETDQHAVEINANYPPGVSLDFINNHVQNSERLLKNERQVDTYYSEMGKKQGLFLQPDDRKLNRSYIYVTLKHEVPSEQFLKEFANKNSTKENLQIDYRKTEPALSGLLGGKTAPLSVYISGPSLSILDSLAEIISKKISLLYPKAIYGSNYFERYPAISLSVNRQRLALHDLTAKQIAEALKNTVHGLLATRLRDFDRRIDIVLKGDKNYRRNLSALLNVRVKGYPLSNFVNVNRVNELSYIEHKDQTRAFRLDLRAQSLSGLAQNVRQIISGISLPAGYSVSLGGEWLESRRSIKHLYFAFMMAVLLVYLILAAQFESFVAPLIIIFTVPLSLIGVIPALLISGMSINIMSVIGLVVIVGIVVNDGILKIDFIRRAHRSGMDVTQAIRYAGKMRLRPILMTTVTTVFGLLPLALGVGPGADLQQPMAVSIIGGESVATILTLFVLPVLYKKLLGRKKY